MRSFILFCLFGMLLSSATRAAAAEIVVTPSRSEVVLSAATPSATVRLTLANTGDLEQVFTIQVADISQVDVWGRVQLQMKPQQGDALTLASYVRVEDQTVLVPPRSSKETVLTISDDPSLSPGSHYSAVLFRGVQQGTQSGQHIIPVVSAFVLVRKEGGERYHISLASVDGVDRAILWSLPSHLTLMFENEGNTHVTPTGTVEVRDIFNRLVAKGIINDGSLPLLPRFPRQIAVSIQQRRVALPLMPYRVLIAGTTRPGARPYAASLVFWYVPKEIVLGILILGSLLVSRYLWSVIRKKR